jgi:hypothetical protein
MISRADLESVEVGQIASIKALLKGSADTVCVLHPYQNVLYQTRGPLAERVNARLANKYYLDEDRLWGLALVDGKSVTVQTFPGSERLQLCDGLPNLSPQIHEVECTTTDEAHVTKVERFGGPCLLFGESQ